MGSPPAGCDTSGIVLFGIGSPICVDIVETCRRNGQPITAGIKNFDGPTYVGDGVDVVDAAVVTPALTALPFLLPLFDPRNRRAARDAAITLGFRQPARLVDRTAIMAGDCVVEAGVYVNAGCIIAGAATLGEFAFCNRGANIGHHCRIGAFASIGPSAILAGLVEVGEASQVGAGAVILPKVRIGVGALIAPGAVVARDVPDHGFAAGNPARIQAPPPAG
jgi:carbonic anhydrase/acetyltransferase-like protein (isoleucine patch superfamily)